MGYVSSSHDSVPKDQTDPVLAVEISLLNSGMEIGIKPNSVIEKKVLH